MYSLRSQFHLTSQSIQHLSITLCSLLVLCSIYSLICKVFIPLEDFVSPPEQLSSPKASGLRLDTSDCCIPLPVSLKNCCVQDEVSNTKHAMKHQTRPSSAILKEARTSDAKILKKAWSKAPRYKCSLEDSGSGPTNNTPHDKIKWNSWVKQHSS